MSPDDTFSLFDLFHQEAKTQINVLTQGLLALERNPQAADQLEALMRAAHSLKGAARIVGINSAVRVAHVMEDCFVAAQQGKLVLHADETDRLLAITDLFKQIAGLKEADLESWETTHEPAIQEAVDSIQHILDVTRGKPGNDRTAASFEQPLGEAPGESVAELGPSGVSSLPPPAFDTAGTAPSEVEKQDRVLRVAAANLNRLLGLAGESLVESRWLTPYSESLLRLKRQQSALLKTLANLRESLVGESLSEYSRACLAQAQQQASACLEGVSSRHEELELFARRSTNLSNRLYSEAIASRMRPFADGVQGFPRLVRDLARSLGKQVRLEIIGENTQVDRDVLDRLESPLTHLLRNAVDHGLETPDERVNAGKPAEGMVRLEARHAGGLLLVLVEDDGRGISYDRVREAVVRRKLTTAEMAEKLTHEELLEFLFLPGFSLRESVTEISGRGVGLDVVQNMVKAVGGSVRIMPQQGGGTKFQLQLPLTLSVLRSLLVDVSGEPYAFPLARIQRTLKVSREEIQTLEGREHVSFDGHRIGLVSAAQILGKTASASEDAISVVVLGERGQHFGVVVDKFIGEKELVLQRLDSRLGKVKDISAAALMPDGSPLLVLDVEDVVRSIELLVSGGRLNKLQRDGGGRAAQRRQRVLLVDDSLTVRELERKLLGNAGYDVEVAVDGMDGWNAARTQPYDLIVTDIDMPRMDGIELVRLIKNDARLRHLPVMIVSYKDRPEDRHRGMEAGADYYLTKGSFHDETLLTAVADLIGHATEVEHG
jgi:two-component system sensor histidine kinase and response regulator WspE